MNQPPPGCRFITVGAVPSEMSTPVGLAGAGTSPRFLAGVASVVVPRAWVLWTTDAGGIRQPGNPIIKIPTGETRRHFFFVSVGMSTLLDTPRLLFGNARSRTYHPHERHQQENVVNFGR